MDNAEVIQRACRAWGDGDLVAIREMYAPDIVADGGALWPEGDAVRGVDAVLETFASIMAVFARSELIPEGFIEVDETYVVPLLWRGILVASDSAVEQHVVGNYRFKDGRIAAMAWYMNLEEALAALGQSPDAGARLVHFEDDQEESAAGHTSDPRSTAT